MRASIVLLLLISSIAFGTTTQELRIAYKKELAKELENPRSKWYYTHTDSYSRLLHVKIMRKLGLDPVIDLFRDERKQPVSEVQSHDTTYFANVSKNFNSQDETTICINKKNKNIIIAGANDGAMYTSGMPVYRTSNGGKTWQTNRIKTGSSQLIASGDPAIICDNDGTFYYAFLSTPTDAFYPDLQVAHSTDGRTWTTGATVAGGSGLNFEDKEWLVIDDNPTSPYFGRLYIVWMRYADAFEESGIHVAWSSDKGMTWSDPVFTEGVGTFVLPRVTNNGTLLFTYSAGGGDGEEGAHVLVSSTDGGSSFVQNIITYFYDYPFNSNLSRPGLKGEGGFRAKPATSFDIDPITGVLHVVYGEWNMDGPGIESAVLYHTTSSDLGGSWSEPKMLGIVDPTSSNAYNDRFFSWLSIDRVTAKKHLIYYSSEDDPDNLLTTVYYLELDDSLSKKPFALKQDLFDPTSVIHNGSPFMGDYIGCDAHDSVFAACWTENRPNFSDGDVFVAVRSALPEATIGLRKVVISSNNVWMSAPYPNPVLGSDVTISYYLPAREEISLGLFNVKGECIKLFANALIEEGTYTETLPIKGVPPGAYILRLKTQFGEVSQKLIVQ
jgi:hypothetical protein